MLTNCSFCNKVIKRKPSEIKDDNYCSRICMYDHRIELNKDTKPFNKFVKSSWTNMNIRCGKYKHLQTVNKCKSYENVRILFTREEFKEWCFSQKELIKQLKRPSIDRIDENGDYCLSNIQIIELSDNIAKSNYANGYSYSKKKRGVKKSGNKFYSRITYQSKELNLGSFDNEEDAYQAFFNKYIELRGEEPW